LHASTELFTSAGLTEMKAHKLLPFVRKHIGDARRAAYEAAFRTLQAALFEIFGTHDVACFAAYTALKESVPKKHAAKFALYEKLLAAAGKEQIAKVIVAVSQFYRQQGLPAPPLEQIFFNSTGWLREFFQSLDAAEESPTLPDGEGTDPLTYAGMAVVLGTVSPDAFLAGLEATAQEN
jgi:hypothetical protein